MASSSYVVKNDKRRSVFHNVPVEREAGEDHYGFRDLLIMEHYASKNKQIDISSYDFRKVVKFYDGVTVEEIIGA